MRWSGWSTQYTVLTSSRCYYAVGTSGRGANYTFPAEIERPRVNSSYLERYNKRMLGALGGEEKMACFEFLATVIDFLFLFVPLPWLAVQVFRRTTRTLQRPLTVMASCQGRMKNLLVERRSSAAPQL